MIAKPEDAATARIGVMTGSTGEAIAAARFPRANLQSFDDIMDAVAALGAGQLDAIVTGRPTALQVAKRNPTLAPLAEALADEDTAIALRKGDPLLPRINDILTGFERDGILASLDRRWFTSDLRPYEEPRISPPAAGVPLRIGVSATREPFSFVDRDGRVTGHDGELARRLAAQLERPLEFVDMKFLGLIPALQAGKLDLIITGMTATEERRRQVDFSRPYYANAQVLLVRKPPSRDAVAAPPLRTVPADLAGRRLAVLLGSAHETWAVANCRDTQILEFKNAADVVLAVQSGKADAGLMDSDPLKEILAANPDLGALPEPLFSFPVAMGFAKEKAALREAFNTFFASRKADGSWARMTALWIDKRAVPQPALPTLPAASPSLVLGTTDVGLPFAAVRENEMVGLDIDLARRFAYAQGRRLEISNMEFSALIAAVAARKVDFISASIFVTEEREKQIDFGSPYYEMGTQLFARRETLGLEPAAQSPVAASAVERVVDSFRNNILREQRYLLILDGLGTTIIISVLSTLAGTLLAGGICWMRLSPRPFVSGLARAYINLIRGMPVLVLLMLIFYVVFASISISPVLVAVIAFGMNFGAYAAEIFRTGIESVDRGQREAGIAMGFTPAQAFRHIVLPQAVRRILPVYRGEFISLVKMTSIVGYIAVQDLTKASDIIRSRTFDAFFPLVMVAVLYFLVSWALMQVLEYAERASDPRRRQGAAP